MSENTENNSKETLSISKDELQAMLNDAAERGAQMAKESGQTGLVRKAVKEHFASLRFIDSRAVVGFVNKGTENRPRYVYTIQDPKNPKENVEMVELILEGMKDGESVPVNFIEFLSETPRVRCKILGRKEMPWEDTQGTTERTSVPEGTFEVAYSGYRVPVTIEGKTTIFSLEIPASESKDGKTRSIDVHEDYVNI